MREVEVLHYARLARTPLLFVAAMQEELLCDPGSIVTTRSMCECCAILQQQALGTHEPTFCNPSSQTINNHVIDLSSQNKLEGFWCQLYVRNKFFIFFPNIQVYLTDFNQLRQSHLFL